MILRYASMIWEFLLKSAKKIISSTPENQVLVIDWQWKDVRQLGLISVLYLFKQSFSSIEGDSLSKFKDKKFQYRRPGRVGSSQFYYRTCSLLKKRIVKTWKPNPQIAVRCYSEGKLLFYPILFKAWNSGFGIRDWKFLRNITPMNSDGNLYVK